MLNRIKILFDNIQGVMGFIASILLIFIVLGVTADVATRLFWHKPISGMVELVTYCMLFMTFLAASWLLTKERHVKMDVVLDRLKPKPQAMLNLITSLLGLVVFIILTWYTGMATWHSFERGTHLTTELDPPLYLILFIIPLGSLMLVIQLIRRTFNFWRDWRMS